ncbi:MAG: metal ABC transporter permease, partial [Solirubrobacteraceae bacterium]
MFASELARNAWLAGTFVALACGTLGWFVVARGQVFASDAFGHVAFVGAIAAATIGVDERVGLFALTLAAAGGLGIARRAPDRDPDVDDIGVGVALAWTLGVGALLLTILATSANGASGVSAVNALFGSIWSLSSADAAIAAAVALAATGIVLSAARPLLLSTLDPELAALRGVPVKLLGLGFLGALAVVSAEGTQAVGALLVLGLVATPAGAAARLTCRPALGIALSASIAVGATWGGLALSWAVTTLPASTAIVGLAAGAYALTALRALPSARSARSARRARGAG